MTVGVIWGFVAAVATAWAFWTGSGVGFGTGSVGTMNAPTNVTATQPNASVRTVHVTWVTPTTPDNSTPTGFTVSRYVGTTASAACGTGTTPLPGTAISCDDTNVASGTYTYKVTMNWSSWTATSNPSSSVTVAASLHHFTVAASTSTPTAGTQFSATITAVDQYGATFADYTGSQCVTFSGPSASPAPASTAPLYPVAGSCTGANSQVSFLNGVGTPNVTLYNAQSTTLTVTDVPTSKTGTSASLTVSPNSASRFVVPTPTTQTAGSSFSLTVTAHDAFDNVATSYANGKTLTWSGPGTAPNGTSTPVYPTNPVSFTAGAATVSITLYKAQAPAITVGDGTITGLSGSFTVSPNSASRFVVPTPTTQTAGSSFSLTVTAHDAFDNVATSYANGKTLTWSGPGTAPNGTSTPVYPTNPVSFTAGAATVSITLYKAEAPAITVGDGTITGLSGSFTVNASSPTTAAVVSGSGQSATVNTAFTSPVVAKVTDAYANAVAGASVTFAAPSSGASATFAASGCTSNPQTYSCIASTNSSGNASSSAFTANGSGGTYNISAQATGTNTVTFSETNVPTLHISSLVTGSTSGTTTWNAAVTVTVKDNSGNLVNGVAVTGAWSPTSAATPSGCTTSSGVCTVTAAANSFPSAQLVESWTVSALTLTGYTYDATSNVESSITVSRTCAAATVCATNLGSSAFQTTASTSSTAATLTGTVPNNSTVLILVARDGSVSGDSVTGVTGTAIGTATQVNAVTSNLSSTAGAFTNLWVYRATGTGTASGTVTATFNNSDNIGTLVQVVVMSGNNTTTPIAQSAPTFCTASCTKNATATLTSPSAANAEVVLVGEAKASGATTSSTTGMTSMFAAQVGGGTGFNASTWSDTSAQATSNFTLGTAAPWGTIGVEVSKSL